MSDMTFSEIRQALEYAPPAKPTQPGYHGHWTRKGYFLCAACASRLIGRGFGSELKEAVFGPNPTTGVCIGCDKAAQRPDGGSK